MILLYRSVLFCICCFFLTPAAFPAVVKGRVMDGKTSDALIGAAVYIKELKMGTTSRQDGTYVFRNIPAGSYTMLVRYLIYVDLEMKDTAGEDAVVELDFRVAPDPKLLNEVTGVGGRDTDS